jgi:signal transduction histidine kinase
VARDELPLEFGQLYLRLIMSTLHRLLLDCETALLERWSGAAQSPSDPSSKDREHLLTFLDSLRRRLLTADRGATLPSEAPEDPSESELDGNVDALAAVRAYTDLHVLILDLATEHNVAISASEHQALASIVHDAIVRATLAHLRSRNSEIHHVAHELRNPLGSAIMALTLLTSRVKLGDEARLAETLARNLERLRLMIDGMVQRLAHDAEVERVARDEPRGQG